ncbi:ComEC family competence protein [Pontibacter qinzhouensis]|uniref:ComEC family competence protein n=1 Tax=Pontibacter qinzhouensis TaxID=2603253 RepID=A0A5C8KCJ7_9BACT|nr:ComEC/Rec2 family competence protein [Pontibacter qinzhouensis]TXK50510.1 ComEC family competence protein [Pontibacter qinzhouensis]
MRLPWAPYPFLRITLCFIAGILIYIFTGKEFRHSQEILAFFILAFVLTCLVSKHLKTAHATAVTGTLGLLCFVAGGIWLTHWHTESHRQDHLLQLPGQPTAYVGVVDDFVAQKTGYQSTVLRLEQVQADGVWRQVTGKVQLSVPHDSEKKYEVRYGDRLLIRGAPQAVPPPTNPNQFDYKQYLANKNIYHRHSLRPQQYQLLGTDPPNPIKYYSIILRRKLDAILQESIEERREYGISTALVLGVKDDMDNAIRSAYSSTGTMHVLAVSGLHVGMIYLPLSLLFKKFRRNKSQRVFGAVVIIGFLMLYAFLTGLSPSVQRAVLMFSLVTVAQAIRRKTNSYNTLAIAAFILLFLDPYYLFDVGFQLSFLAVLGIVYLQPKLNRVLDFSCFEAHHRPFNFKEIKKAPLLVAKSMVLSLPETIWVSFTLSVAAQLATSPLGIFYFYQFPVYFWFANLLVVPLAMLVLYMGVGALFFSCVPLLGWALFRLHFGLIWCMNEFNLWVEQLPHAVVQGIDINALQTWLLYGIMLLLLLFMAYRRLSYLAVAVLVTAMLAFQQIQKSGQQFRQQRFAVYNLRGNTAFALVNGKKAAVVSNAALHPAAPDYTFNVQPHLWQQGVMKPDFTQINSSVPPAGAAYAMLPDSNIVYQWQDLRLLVLTKPLKVQPPELLNPDFVLITKNARLVPEDLQPLQFRKLILDASNSPWYLERLKPQLLALHIPFHDVSVDGAFVAELE